MQYATVHFYADGPSAPFSAQGTQAKLQLRDGTVLLDSGDTIRLDSGTPSMETVAVMGALARSRGLTEIDVNGAARFTDEMLINLKMQTPEVNVRNRTLSPDGERELDKRLKAQADAEYAQNPKALDVYWDRILDSGRPMVELPLRAQTEAKRRWEHLLESTGADPAEVSLGDFVEVAAERRQAEVASASTPGQQPKPNRTPKQRPAANDEDDNGMTMGVG